MRLLEELVISPGAVINGTRMSIREFYFGDMYHFSYNNPKTKDTLEFWDKRPNIFCLGYNPKKRLIIGINLDFVFPFPRREKLVNMLTDMKTQQPRRLLQLAWIDRWIRLRFSKDDTIRLKLAIRTYKYNRVGKVERVPENLWAESIKTRSLYVRESQGKIKSILAKRFMEIKHGR